MASGRIDTTVNQTELTPLIDKLQLQPLTTAQVEGGRLHLFVRGMMFSGELLDLMQEYLPAGYKAGWGQLIDRDGDFFSPESDIIIYEGNPVKTWKTSCFKYILVRDNQAHVVIQCRATIKTLGKDLRKYARDVKVFSPQVWLFTECCWAKTPERCAQLALDAKKAGYEKFFYLYDHTTNGEMNVNLAGWQEFKAELSKLKTDKTVKRRKRKR